MFYSSISNQYITEEFRVQFKISIGENRTMAWLLNFKPNYRQKKSNVLILALINAVIDSNNIDISIHIFKGVGRLHLNVIKILLNSNILYFFRIHMT